jgi:tetratricopeptide (TPR) repeat protein
LPVGDVPVAPPNVETVTPAETVDTNAAPTNAEPVAIAPPADAATEQAVQNQTPPEKLTTNLPEDLIVELELPAEQAVDKRLSGSAARKEADRLFAEGEKILAGKDYINAGMKFRQALAYRNDHLGAHLSLGMCLLKLGRLESAYEHFGAALALDKDYAPTHYNLASYYALKNDPVGSIGSLKRAITLYPKIKSWVKTDPDFDSIRSNPEFTKLIN